MTASAYGGIRVANRSTSEELEERIDEIKQDMNDLGQGVRDLEKKIRKLAEEIKASETVAT